MYLLATFKNSDAVEGIVQLNPDDDSDTEVVSLVRLKDAARRLLSPNSVTRSMILGEKDSLPLQEAIAKFEIFDRLLLKELG